MVGHGRPALCALCSDLCLRLITHWAYLKSGRIIPRVRNPVRKTYSGLSPVRKVVPKQILIRNTNPGP